MLAAALGVGERVAAQGSAPVAIPPGAVPLIVDEPDQAGLPLHFRTAADPYHADSVAPPPPREGLDALRMSGSAQFSAAGLDAIVELVGTPLVVVDLRQESHGFLDDVPVSWYALHDQVNVVRSLVEVQQDERRRLDALAANPETTALAITQKSATGTPIEGRPRRLITQPALTERELVRSRGIGYLRVPATDFLPPTAENVDRFVSFAASLPPETWLHFHCHGGDGRTTTFMAMWDMMHNAARVSVEDIVRRQAAIGPTDLFAVGTEDDWTHPFRVERVHFLRRFHAYAREQAPHDFVVPYSTWLAMQPAGATPVGAEP